MRLSASRIAIRTLPKRDPTIAADTMSPSASMTAEAKQQRGPRAVGLHGEAEDVLEVGQAVVAAKPMSLRKNASISA